MNSVVSLAGVMLALGMSTAMADDAASGDPYLWLEEVEGEKPLDWVRERNAAAQKEIEAAPGFAALRNDLRGILDSTAKIPYVQKIGEHYYNLWKDAEHERGLWRRTTLDDYRKADPAWETVLDIDALGKAEGVNWVWGGADCLAPDYTRCLVNLSRGGADATVTREFDLTSKTFVKGGFERPESKGGLGWIDADRVYVFTDFGAESMTSSGYPRTVREWTRGSPMSDAKMVYEGKTDDMYIAAIRDHTEGFERDYVSRTLAFYNDELYLRGKDGQLQKIDAPNDAQKSVHREWLLLELRAAFDAGGKTWPAGALIVTRFDDFMAGKRDFVALFEPPTLLYGYGGFEVSLTPNYRPVWASGWLSQGGVYAAGQHPRWWRVRPALAPGCPESQSHKAYEDFAAIADDLVARKITSPAHLGTMGGSNGGLLMGNMLTQYPELFGAIVVQVPLLDMKRYSHLLAGASWMAEYGDPDTADWDFIQKLLAVPPVRCEEGLSGDPVHHLDQGRPRPSGARAQDDGADGSAGKDVRYYENIEGGHGGAANNAQSAHMKALAYSFLCQQLFPQVK
jgi:prolyl oligopeptidase PreP (S9A serine peptidase family)